MNWPNFDGAKAINQAVGGLYTLVGVFAGGYLAFWLGVRQLRKSRAIDRRLEWHEKLHADLSRLQDALRDLATAARMPPPFKQSYTKTAMDQARESGRALEKLLRSADLYGTPSERDSGTQLSLKTILAQSQTLGRDLRTPIETASPEELDKLADELESHRLELVARIRAEIGLVPRPGSRSAFRA